MFWGFIVLFVLALIAWVVRRGVAKAWSLRVEASNTRGGTKPLGFTVAASILSGLALVCLLASIIFSVGTKEVGIPTSFGAVGSTHYGAGPHLKLPWVSIHTMDGAIQTADFGVDSGGGGKVTKSGCLNVRIANNQTGCAAISLQWRINPAQTDYLYKNYRSFDHVKQQLVDRKLFNTVNEVLADYNPLQYVSQKGEANPLPGYASKIYFAMQKKVKDINGKPLVEIINVQLPIVHFDDQTQSRINQIQQQVAQTAIAKQREQTNAAEARANAALVHQKDGLSQLILESRCLDTVDSMIKANQPVPPGYNCLGGSNPTGIIANTTPAAK